LKIKRFDTAANNLAQFLKASAIDTSVFEENVRKIAQDVRERGDNAILDLTLKFDGVQLDNQSMLVADYEIEEAYEIVEDDFLFALRKAIDNIMIFHSRQSRNSWMESDEAGNVMGQVYHPIKRAGIYVPGGTAAYPSSVLMNAIPAQVAGVEQIVMVTPPGSDGKLNPYTLVAAAELGLEEIYKMGGAQAVFALAWGTQSIPKVDIITGPGNIYVTLAKKMVYGDVNIDMLAGPSEILIVADSNANPVHVAADMMSQAEHDVLARSILVTDHKALLDQVEKELQRQVQKLERKAIIEKALNDHGAFILVDNIEEACEVANLVAPEHLELMVEHPFELLHKIENAGAIFLGANTPEPVGDYLAGPNHILPTGGTARFYSPVTVDTFRKVSNIIYYSPQGIKDNCDDIIRLAQVEGLTAHANSLKVRKGE
jgi:histidinol dehydrogenase